MDDTTWIAPNQKHLQQILNTATQFYKINDIHINPDKSQLLIINGKNTDFDTGVSMDNTIIPGCKKGIPVRILGVWHDSAGNKKYQKQLIHNKILITRNLLGRKKITDKQMRYIINHVLTPSLEYLLNDIILPE